MYIEDSHYNYVVNFRNSLGEEKYDRRDTVEEVIAEVEFFERGEMREGSVFFECPH